MKKNHFWQFIWCTLIPIVVPFIPEIPDDYIANPIKYGLMIILLVIDILFIWKFYKLTNKDFFDFFPSYFFERLPAFVFG